jgi:hypothetical protein
MPSEPSDFVAGILEPLATVLILKGEFVTPGEREKWARDVLEPTTSRYCAARDIKSAEMSCEQKCRLLRLIGNLATDSQTIDTWLQHRYAEITSEVLSTVNKTEASLLRLRKTRKKKEGGAAALGTDEDKIRRQLFLDAEAFGMQVCQIAMQLAATSME